MRLSIFTTTLSALALALALAAAASCGADGPDAPNGSVGGQASTAPEGGSTTDDEDDDPDAQSSDGGDSGEDSSAGGSDATDAAGGGPSEPPPTCSIMSSNVSCKSCLEQSCCEVLHACLDEDLLGCTACLDCFLSGQGPGCCDESVGKNDWLAECVAFNCAQAC